MLILHLKEDGCIYNFHIFYFLFKIPEKADIFDIWTIVQY